jgi:hypothetical protein
MCITIYKPSLHLEGVARIRLALKVVVGRELCSYAVIDSICARLIATSLLADAGVSPHRDRHDVFTVRDDHACIASSSFAAGSTSNNVHAALPLLRDKRSVGSVSLVSLSRAVLPSVMKSSITIKIERVFWAPA